MKEFKKVTIGSDVEVFLSTERGEPVSAVGLIDGGKEDPVVFLPGYGLQRDNVMAEFNIPPIPLGDKIGFAEAFKTCLEHLSKVIPSALRIHIVPSVEMDDNQLQCEEACTFGCSPFFDIYKQPAKGPVQDESIYAEDVGNFRFAGGHIHIGWEGAGVCHHKDSGMIVDQREYEKKLFLASLCDVFLLLPSYAEDMDDRRRQYYGKPGKVRFKPYGIEYRSLSNYFVRDETIMMKIMDRLSAMLEFANNVDPGDYLTAVAQHRKMVFDFVANPDKRERILAAECCKFELV